MGYTNRKINEDSWLIQCDSHVSMYLIEGTEKAMLIDAGMEKDDLFAYCRELTDKPIFCVLTHGHFDHIGRCGEFAEVYLDFKDKELYAQHSTGPFLKQIDPCCKTAEELREMQKEFDLGDRRIITVSVPGHTPGSVCLIVEDAMFSGDTLFAGSCGRTDLPGGDWATIQSSLRRLAELPSDYRIFPGHGESTSLTQEKQTNPYLR